MPNNQIIAMLSELFNENIQVQSVNTNNKISLQFKETRNPTQTKLKTITITGLDCAVAINHDLTSFIVPEKKQSKTQSSPHLFPSIKSSETCDGIIFCVQDNQPYILIFDMKSSLNDYQGFRFKTMSGKSFVSYIKCILQTFKGVNLDSWIIKYGIFYESSPKRTIGIDLNTSSLSLDACEPNFIKVSNEENIPINKLLGKSLL